MTLLPSTQNDPAYQAALTFARGWTHNAQLEQLPAGGPGYGEDPLSRACDIKLFCDEQDLDGRPCGPVLFTTADDPHEQQLLGAEADFFRIFHAVGYPDLLEDPDCLSDSGQETAQAIRDGRLTAAEAYRREGTNERMLRTGEATFADMLPSRASVINAAADAGLLHDDLAQDAVNAGVLPTDSNAADDDVPF